MEQQPKAPPTLISLPKTHKIPLIPIAVAIAVIIIASAAYLLVLAPQPAVFKAFVFAGTDKIANATVQAFDGKELLATAETDASGVATFKDLPLKLLSFKVSKEGYPTVSFTADLSRTLTKRADFLAATANTGGFSFRVVVQDESGNPVSGARVASTIEGKTETSFTDATGNSVVIASKGAFVRLRVTATGFKSESLAIIAQRSSETIHLKKQARTVDKGTITARVIDRATQTGISTGTLFVYEDSRSVLLANATISNGNAVVEGIATGTSVYFMVDSPAYVFPASASIPRVTVEEETAVTIALDSVGSLPAANTTLRTIDQNGQLVAADVYLGIYPSSRTLPPISSSGTVTRLLSTNATYYAVAVAPGRVYGRTSQFNAGETQTITLPSATSANSVTLTVNPVDEDEQPLGGMLVSLFENGLFALPALETTFFNPSVTFDSVPRGANLEIRAVDSENARITASSSVTADSDKNVTLTVRANAGFLDITTEDIETGNPVSATFTSTYKDETYDSCTGFSCSLAVRSYDTLRITGKAPGYLDFFYEGPSLQAGLSRNITAKLVPAARANATYAQFLELLNVAGDSVTVVRPGTDYTARVLFVSTTADYSGLHFRIGGAGDTSTDLAGFTDYPQPESGLARSTSYTPSGSCGKDVSNNNASDGLFKWVELQFPGGTYSGILEFKIHVKENAPAGANLALFDRAYMVRGNLWYRNPYDKDLKFALNTSSRDNCYAQADETDFPVIKPAEELILPSKDFTEKVNVRFNRFTGKIEIPLTEIKLQIDPIMPADAVPINVQDPACSILANVQAADQTQGCYKITKNSVLFESGDTNPACPIKASKDTIDGDSGANVSFVGACAGLSSTVTIPIRVVNESAESVFVKPRGEELGDGDAAKLIYLVNNKQAGTRTLRVTTDQPAVTPKDFTFNNPGVQAIAWRGPGTLSVLEGNRTLSGGSITYTERVPYLFESGTVGARVTSCSDFKCCSSGWCTRGAFNDAFDNFKDVAETVSNTTAFRRGGGEPYKTVFPNQKFRFNTVAQIIQGSNDVLRDANIQLVGGAANTATCRVNNPGAYQITAESDGANFTYKAQVLPLFKYNYITPCNEPLPAGDQIPLCNFLFGNSTCINSDAKGNGLTTDQAKTLKYNVIVCAFPTYPAISLPLCLLPAGQSVLMKTAACSKICTSACSKEGATGASVGAAVGSVIPGAGTAVGAALGAGVVTGSCALTCERTCKQVVTASAPTLFPKITILQVKGEIEENATTQEAFHRIGSTLSKIDWSDAKWFEVGEANWKGGGCGDIVTNFKRNFKGYAFQAAGGIFSELATKGRKASPDLIKSGRDLLDGIIPAVWGVCRGDNGQFRDLQLWPPILGGADPINPGRDVSAEYFITPATIKPQPLHRCGGIFAGLSSGGTLATGSKSAITLSSSGDTVELRMDIGMNGNCDPLLPFTNLDWVQVVGSAGLSGIGYWLSGGKDLAFSLQSQPSTVNFDATKVQTVETLPDGTTITSDAYGRSLEVHPDGTQILTQTISGETYQTKYDPKTGILTSNNPVGYSWTATDDKGNPTGTWTSRDTSKGFYYTSKDGQLVITEDHLQTAEGLTIDRSVLIEKDGNIYRYEVDKDGYVIDETSGLPDAPYGPPPPPTQLLNPLPTTGTGAVTTATPGGDPRGPQPQMVSLQLYRDPNDPTKWLAGPVKGSQLQFTGPQYSTALPIKCDQYIAKGCKDKDSCNAAGHKWCAITGDTYCTSEKFSDYDPTYCT